MVTRDNEEHAFIGFITRVKKQQIEILNKYKNTNCVFYESPNRLIETLQNIKAEYGVETKIAVARELTKVYEEVKTGTVDEILKYYSNNPLKGEIVAMVFARDEVKADESELLDKIKILKEQGFSQKDTAKIIASLYGENRNKIYKLTLSE